MTANDEMAVFLICGDEGEWKISGPFESREDARADIELSGCRENHGFVRGPMERPYELPTSTRREREWQIARAAASRVAL